MDLAQVDDDLLIVALALAGQVVTRVLDGAVVGRQLAEEDEIQQLQMASRCMK